MKQALFFEKADENKVQCRLCPHGCTLPKGATGLCRGRKNINGSLYSMNYARIASISLDPVEKKPLFHFHPGKQILSVGTFGCNFKCSYCQNWTISQEEARTTELSPAELADLALRYTGAGNIGVAYTYNEPSVWYEYIYDTAVLVKEEGLNNVLVTNGFLNKEPLEQLLPYMDAMNIDVKAFNTEFYKKYCGGNLEDVMKTVERAAGSCHVEITTLVIPGLNDSMEEIERLARWLSSINRNIVLHLTRFFPNYRLNQIPPTPLATLESAANRAQKHLEYVYIGNV